MIDQGHRLELLVRAVASARAGGDVEAVHQLRVGTRRLDAWLRIGEHRVLRDDLAWLRAACGHARNLDVLLAREGLPPSFRTWLEAQRAAEAPALAKALFDPRVDASLEALGRMPGVPRGPARHKVGRLIERVAARGRDVDARSDDLEALHTLRRSVRVLRFALEWVGEEAPFLVHIQDAFGELNDTAVLARVLEQFLDADPEYVREAGDHLVRARKSVVRAWRRDGPELVELAETWNST